METPSNENVAGAGLKQAADFPLSRLVWPAILAYERPQPQGPCLYMAPSGEVAEWLNAPHSKCGIGASLSGVRIPPSPPFCLEPLIPTASRPVSPPSSPRA